MQEGMCKNCGSIVYVDPKQKIAIVYFVIVFFRLKRL